MSLIQESLLHILSRHTFMLQKEDRQSDIKRYCRQQYFIIYIQAERKSLNWYSFNMLQQSTN